VLKDKHTSYRPDHSKRKEQNTKEKFQVAETALTCPQAQRVREHEQRGARPHGVNPEHAHHPAQQPGVPQERIHTGEVLQHPDPGGKDVNALGLSVAYHGDVSDAEPRGGHGSELPQEGQEEEKHRIDTCTCAWNASDLVMDVCYFLEPLLKHQAADQNRMRREH
jgi:hypothetical protein